MAHRPELAAHQTIADLVLHLDRTFGERERFFTVHRGDTLEELSCRELIRRAHALAVVLDVGGIQKGDRVAIFAENRPEWHLVDFACQLLGTVSVPIFPNLPSDQVGKIVADSGARWVVYSDAPKRDLLQDLERWLADPPGLVAMDEEARPRNGHLLTELIERGDGLRDAVTLEDLRARVTPDDLSSLLYTSGTTGQPKGVMLTHRNLTTNYRAACEVYPGNGGADEQCVCFLPLSHVFARTTSHCFLALGIAMHYVQSVDELPRALLEIRPTVTASVPLVFEKAFQRIQQTMEEQSDGKKKLFQWAVDSGHRELEQRVRGRRPGLLAGAKKAIADTLVYRKIQERFGGRLQLVVAGGAPMPTQVETFFQAVGVEIYQGYGLTETAPLLTINYPGRYRPGSAGVAGPGVELRIADDGEILARSPGVMRGYWKQPTATADVIDAQRWFHTGDLGHLDEDGFLFITGRKKDLLVTAAGENIAPVPIEHLLIAAPLIAQAMVVGDQRPHLAALLVPEWSQLSSTGERADAVDDPDVRAQVAEIVESVNRLLPEHERIRAWSLLADVFTVEGGELTPTLKVRRPVVAQRYAAEIEALYREA
ncbi:MAG: long-chain fatty acid--CoA ligase [Acidobacteriota bacterium]